MTKTNLQKAEQKLIKARKKFYKAQEHYNNMREDVSLLMEKKGLTTALLDQGNIKYTFKTGRKCSVTKADVLQVKKELSKTEFKALFSLSYSLPYAKFNSLTDKEVLSILSPVVTVSETPLSVTDKPV